MRRALRCALRRAGQPSALDDRETFTAPGTWTVVPEPSPIALLGTGLASLFTWLLLG